jgi:hypothetical protein
MLVAKNIRNSRTSAAVVNEKNAKKMRRKKEAARLEMSLLDFW